MGSAILDGIRKIVRPDTYSCNLCAVTYSVFKEKQLWKDFRNEFPAEMTFLHKDEFQTTYRSKWLPKYCFPVILLQKEHELEVFISSEEIDRLRSAKELIELIRQRSGRD
jgi:hypothetical protein